MGIRIQKRIVMIRKIGSHSVKLAVFKKNDIHLIKITVFGLRSVELHHIEVVDTAGQNVRWYWHILPNFSHFLF